MRARFPTLLAIAACASILAGGCDTGDVLDELNPFDVKTTGELAAERTLEDFTEAVDDEDWDAACELLTDRAARELAGEGSSGPEEVTADSPYCRVFLAIQFEGVDLPSGPIEVDSSTERGSNLLVTLTDGSEFLMDGGGGRIASFDP